MLQTPRDVHQVTTAQAYRALIATAMAKKRKFGDKTAKVVEVTTPITAYIGQSRWLIDCECGAGNMVDPQWKLAGCLGCGRIHSNVIVPVEHAAIESVLAQRPHLGTRNWKPSESVGTLVAENMTRGLPHGLAPIRKEREQ